MMEEYIWRRQNTFVLYISIQLLLDLCEGTERAPVSWLEMRWWNHAGINLVEAR